MSSASNGHAAGGASRSSNTSSSLRQRRQQQQQQHLLPASLSRTEDQQTLAAARALAALPQAPVPQQKLCVVSQQQQQQQQQPLKIVSVVSKAPPGTVANGGTSVPISALLPTVPIPPTAINGQKLQSNDGHPTIFIQGQGRPTQQRQQQQQQQQQQRPRGSCHADIVTNSMKSLRQKGSSFLRTHASKHGITNASRKLTSQVLQELTMHYINVHGIDMHLDDTSTSLAASAPTPTVTNAAVNGHRPPFHPQGVANVLNAVTVTPQGKKTQQSQQPQTIQIQVQPRSVQSQLSFLTPVSNAAAAGAPIAVLPQEPVTVVTPLSAASGAPAGPIKILPADPLVVSTGIGASGVVGAPPIVTASNLASILPKHPLPQAQIVVTAVAQQQQQQSVSQQLAQLRPIAQVRPPHRPSSTSIPVVLPTKPVAPSPSAASSGAPTVVATASSSSSSNNNKSGGGSRSTTNSNSEGGGGGAANGGVVNGGHSQCTSRVIAKTRPELAACGTSMLRPEAAAHKVHNASRKPKEQVIEELWQHYLACHAVDLDSAAAAAATTTTSTAASTAVTIAPEAPSSTSTSRETRSSTKAARSAAAADLSSPAATAPVKRRRVPKTTIAQVAEAAAAAAEGWVGNVLEDEDEDAKN